MKSNCEAASENRTKKYENNQKNTIQINCFGRLSIYMDGMEMGILMNSAKARELIAFLMTYRGAAVSKTTVCDALWRDVEIQRSKDCLYKLEKKVKQMQIPFLLESNRGMVQLRLDNVESDMMTFLSLIKERQDVKKLESAVMLYEGSLFEEENYEWVMMKDAVYDNQYLDAVNYLQSYYAKLQESERAYYYASLMRRYA